MFIVIALVLQKILQVEVQKQGKILCADMPYFCRPVTFLVQHGPQKSPTLASSKVNFLLLLRFLFTQVKWYHHSQ